MRPTGTLILCAALVLVLSSPAFAQAPAKPAEAARPAALPALFPADSKFAFIDFQRIAAMSDSGKLALKILRDLQVRKVAEIEAQNKQLQALAARRDAGALSGSALSQLGKEMAKLQREIEFAQESAQAEVRQRESELQTDLQSRVVPVVADIAKEKGVYAVLTSDSGLFYLHPALDISDEVIKRLDAQPKK